MELIEKNIPVKETEPMDMSMFNKMAKLPNFLIKILLKKGIGMIRESMGGNSRDISKRAIKTENRKIDGYKGKIRIQIYVPEGTKKRPILVFYHGGGWVGGSMWAVENFCKGVCDQADCVGINVEYHLAPENPFPVGLEDSYAAIKWAVDNAEYLQIDPSKIILGGDSAGGNFAAAISLMARERKEFSIDKQILIYAATNLAEPMMSDTSKFPPGLMKVNGVMANLYFKGKVDKKDPRISPIFAKDFSNFPATLMTVGDQDFLYESSLKFAKKLDAAGTPVKFILYKNANHAFIDNTGNSAIADDFVREAAEFIKY
ncbi:MAG: alpha/beta hydrolase [Promethearchaeota archaeon]